VLRLKSYECAGADVNRVGSGILIECDQESDPESRYFLVTSSHVPLHGGPNEGICHEVVAANGAARSVALAGANIFLDLALLGPLPPDFVRRAKTTPIPLSALAVPLAEPEPETVVHHVGIP